MTKLTYFNLFGYNFQVFSGRDYNLLTVKRKVSNRFIDFCVYLPPLWGSEPFEKASYPYGVKYQTPVGYVRFRGYELQI